MREPTIDNAVIRHFLATSRWYLLQARIATDAAGRVSIQAPLAANGAPALPPRRAPGDRPARAA